MAAERAKTSGSDKNGRRVFGRTREDASFPVPPAARDMPHDYALMLEELKTRIQEERLMFFRQTRQWSSCIGISVGLFWTDSNGKAGVQR